jgi:septum formation protein
LGKPENKDQAREMLLKLSGKTHTVITGIAVCESGVNQPHVRSMSVTSTCTLYPLTDTEIESYLSSNDWQDKAGAISIQGKAALFIQQIQGDYYNIVGVPVARLNKLLNM